MRRVTIRPGESLKTKAITMADISNPLARIAIVAALLATAALLHAQTPDATVFRRVELPMIGEQPLPAMTLLVPEGWRIEGGIQRTPPELRSMFVLRDVQVKAPDGRTVHFYPGMVFRYSSMTQAQPMQPMDGGFFCPPPESIGQWILMISQGNLEPGVTDLRLVSEEPLPQTTQWMRRFYGPQIQDMARMASSPADQPFGDAMGTMVRFAYNHHGRPMEETFVVAWMIMGMKMNGQMAMCFWSIVDMRSVAGPAGSNPAADPVLATIAHSARYTPQYFEAMHGYFQRLYRRPPTQTVAQMRSGSDSVSDILHEGWKRRSGMTDAGQQREVDMIHERTPYTTPHGQTVHLSSHYRHVYSDGQDRYLLSNNPNWDPRTDPAYNGRTWHVLQPQRYE